MNQFYKNLIQILSMAILCSYSIAAETHKLNEFWIWPQYPVQEIDNINTNLYILRGLFKAYNGRPAFIEQGNKYKNLKSNIILVYRMNHLFSAEFVADVIKTDLDKWSKLNANIIGVQFDYDSPTRKLNLYSDFIANFRKRIGPKYKVSVTGLADWLGSSCCTKLKLLHAQTDFIAMQLYTHGKMLPKIKSRISDLSLFEKPFKVGLLDKEEYKFLPSIAKLNQFKGFIYFKGIKK